MRLNGRRLVVACAPGGILVAVVVLMALAAIVLMFGSRATTVAGGARNTQQQASSSSLTGAPQGVVSAYHRLPLIFEPNQGQSDPQVKFLARGSGYGLFLTVDKAVLTLRHSATGNRRSLPASSVVSMTLDGASANPTVSGADQLPG